MFTLNPDKLCSDRYASTVRVAVGKHAMSANALSAKDPAKNQAGHAGGWSFLARG
jgi:hypothetical protein